jgi:hypothetical protein
VTDPDSRQFLLRQGRLLEIATLGWHIAGVAILAIAAVRAHWVAQARVRP